MVRVSLGLVLGLRLVASTLAPASYPSPTLPDACCALHDACCALHPVIAY